MPRVRTFIGLDLGKALRDRLVSFQEKLDRAGAEVKWVEPDNLHLTLLFLGEVDQREVIDVCRAVQTAANQFQPFTMVVAGPGAFPNARRPRVVWIGVTDGAQEVTALHDALEVPLLELGCYRREQRQFTPHITLGRIKGQEGSSLEQPLAKHQSWTGGSTLVREVLVMASELTPDGPIYTVLGRGKLAQ